MHISTQVHIHNLSICGSELEIYISFKSVAKNIFCLLIVSQKMETINSNEQLRHIFGNTEKLLQSRYRHDKIYFIQIFIYFNLY